ncbi:serine/threonine-protein kinase [Streptomyces adelaidensis]|uniref:serine/threonine-protein kinase n=1 Tax=Streptomyces adelaidensis TaxID=2796465 RepID=UPI0019041EB9|nr:serine/threonine-protein kinase [Streptomyces adelaidensis]
MKPLRAGDPLMLGQFRLVGRLGSGGMGRVFLARAPDGRAVAVKLIHPHLAEEPEFRLRFRREVAAVRRVAGAGTARVLDSDTEGETPWFATEFVPGPALHRVVDEWHGPLPPDSVWHLARGLAAGLSAIHGLGVLHRDLKPSNVLITLDGPTVIDFGIARAVDSSVATRTGAVIGSPGFMSPEQVRGERVGEKSDVFGLGAVLAYAATGRSPFESTGEDAPHAVLMRVLSEPPRLDGLDGPLHDLVERCLARDPADRPAAREIEAEATRVVGPGTPDVWLPPAVTARLGQEAARLLTLEGPVPTQVDGGPGLHHAPTATAWPTPVPAGGGTPGHPAATFPRSAGSTTAVPDRRPAGRAPLLAALGTALAAVLAITLVLALRDGDGGENDAAAVPQRSATVSDADDRPPTPDTSTTPPSTKASPTKPSPTKASPTAPEQFDFDGTWQGTVNQGEGASVYDVRIRYTGGKTGERVAEVEYPKLSCGGYWTLRHRTDSRVDVMEHITYGTGGCLDEVEISLTGLDTDTARYSFDTSGEGLFGSSDLVGEGELTRE